MNAKCAVSLGNHLRAVADELHPLGVHQCYSLFLQELHEKPFACYISSFWSLILDKSCYLKFLHCSFCNRSSQCSSEENTDCNLNANNEKFLIVFSRQFC